MTNRFPPIDFPLYGLDASWTGPRWLDFFEGKAGSPCWGVWLGHGHDPMRSPGHEWAVVGSFPRERYDLRLDETLEHAVARVLLLDGSRDAGQVESESARWASWATVAWTVDGTPVTAHRAPREGSWAAFTTDLPDMAVVVQGDGLPKDNLALTRVTDAAPYHFDPDSTLAYPDVIRASREAAFGS